MIRKIPPAGTPISLKDISRALSSFLYNPEDYFLSEIKAFFNTKYCFLFSSGRASLTVILNALKEIDKRRNKIIIPAFTCYSVASSVIRAGLNMKLCDIDKNSLDFDFNMLSDILKKDKDKILAIISVHLFGLKSDIDKVRSIAGEEVYIIEDAAQCFGFEEDGKKFGTFGDIGFFSLGRGKSVSSVGGGIVITDRKDICKRLQKIFKDLPSPSLLDNISFFIYGLSLSLFMHPQLYWIPSLLPFLGIGKTVYDPDFSIKKISPVQIGFFLSWKEKIKKIKEKRIYLTKYWAEFFEDKSPFYSFVSKEKLKELIRFPLRVDDRKIRKKILNKGKRFGISKSYPDSINNIEEIKEHFLGKTFPNAKYIADHLITVPVHPFLKEKDIKKICNLFEEVIQIE